MSWPSNVCFGSLGSPLARFDSLIVSHFNSYLRGGASTAARQLHGALLKQGIESRFQYLAGQPERDRGRGDFPTHWRRRGGFAKTVDRLRYRAHRVRFKRSLRRDRNGSEIFTTPYARSQTAWPPLEHPAAEGDRSRQHVIHLHWIAKFIDVPSFFASIDSQQPVVWTLHDMNALTGGCHFSEHCEQFRRGCGDCPQLRVPSTHDVSAKYFATKRAALAGKNVHVVAPSRWLIELARVSPIFAEANSFTRIPYGMPVDRLYPLEIDEAKAALGIAPEQFVIAFGAMDLANRRKGADKLVAALSAVAHDPRVTCLVFGSGDLNAGSHSLPPTVHVGHVSDDGLRRQVYSAADVFVLPSTEDNLPLTGLEAMACGTPVIGFDAGGIPDYVIPGRTGLLASNHDAEQLAQCLRHAVEHPDQMRTMSRQARDSIISQYESSLEAGRYIQLYRNLFESIRQPIRRAA